MQGFGSTGGFSFPRSNIYIESKSNNFEFEFPVGSYSTSESSSIGPKVMYHDGLRAFPMGVR